MTARALMPSPYRKRMGWLAETAKGRDEMFTIRGYDITGELVEEESATDRVIAGDKEESMYENPEVERTEIIEG